jgi:hypothetical protein
MLPANILPTSADSVMIFFMIAKQTSWPCDRENRKDIAMRDPERIDHILWMTKIVARVDG